MKEISVLDMKGFRLGNAQDTVRGTGCTVLLFDSAAPAGVDIRGGGPASRETPLLHPLAAAEGIHAILLSGGSAFGLSAAGGVMRFLEEREIGFDTGVRKVPLVCQAGLFDLIAGDRTAAPDEAMAYAACEAACRRDYRDGNFGAGTGCTVGKYRGPEFAVKSGIGSFAVQVGAVQVGAVVAVNALGDVFDKNGRQIAGLLNEKKNGFLSTEEELYRSIERQRELFSGNTTIGAVVTNGKFNKAQMNKIAAMAQNGIARAIRPVHTTADGDSVYAASVGQETADLNSVGTLAAYVMEEAVRRGVLRAEKAYGFSAAPDVPGGKG